MADRGYVRVWADIAQAKRCRWCRKPIVLRTTTAGKTIAFDAGLTSLGVERHEVRQVRIETLRWDDAHRCTKRPQKQRAPKPDRWTRARPQRELF